MTSQLAGQGLGGLADFVEHGGWQAVGRDGAGRIAGVDAGFFDVFHDAGHEHVLAVANGVDVDFGGIFEKAVDEHRLALGHDEGLGHEALELAVVVADLHGAAPEHEAGANQRGVADLGDFGAGLRHAAGDAVGGLLEVEPLEHFGEFLAVFGFFDRVDAWCR